MQTINILEVVNITTKRREVLGHSVIEITIVDTNGNKTEVVMYGCDNSLPNLEVTELTQNTVKELDQCVQQVI